MQNCMMHKKHTGHPGIWDCAALCIGFRNTDPTIEKQTANHMESEIEAGFMTLASICRCAATL